eukprot:13465888-Heterocapsa_arctica.AAC.1
MKGWQTTQSGKKKILRESAGKEEGKADRAPPPPPPGRLGSELGQDQRPQSGRPTPHVHKDNL